MIKTGKSTLGKGVLIDFAIWRLLKTSQILIQGASMISTVEEICRFILLSSMWSIASSFSSGKLTRFHFLFYRQTTIQTMTTFWRDQKKKQTTSKCRRLITPWIGCSVSLERSSNLYSALSSSPTLRVESMESGVIWPPKIHTSTNTLEPTRGLAK